MSNEEENNLPSFSRLSPISPLVYIADNIIDLRKIERVGKIGGDISWLRYSVYFISGRDLEIYHERKYVGDIEVIQMDREKFIELWRAVNGC